MHAFTNIPKETYIHTRMPYYENTPHLLPAEYLVERRKENPVSAVCPSVIPLYLQQHAQVTVGWKHAESYLDPPFQQWIRSICPLASTELWLRA